MTEQQNSVEDKELTEYIENTLGQAQDAASKEAQRRIKKNKREIRRLNKHATECLLNGNKAGYMYAIGKFRKMINKEVSDDILESLWKTSVERLDQIFEEEHAKLKVQNQAS